MRDKKESEQLALLLSVVTVHCFFHSTCSHIVQSASPQDAHDLMEQHYAEKHQQQIKKLCRYNAALNILRLGSSQQLAMAVEAPRL